MVDKPIIENGSNENNGRPQGGERPDAEKNITENPRSEAQRSPATAPPANADPDDPQTIFAGTRTYQALVEEMRQPGAPENSIIGRTIENKFKVLRKIGDGGMGIVYEAEHLHLNKRFAIKSIRSKYTHDPDFLARFNQEARTQALLQHPNIIQVTDYISEGGHFYLVMEYMQGKGLNQLIKERQLGEEELLSIAKDVLQSLHHAHSKGIIHRDIKPSNIMIADDHRANLMDFGIAFLVGDKTKQIDVAGSPLYMSPEQLNRPETMDHRTDIYSMGIVMFEMFTGRKPYDGKPDDGTRFDMDVGEVLTATSDCAPELAEIVAKCMEWRPEDRFKDCQEIISRIEAYERQTHLECRKCKTINRVRDKYHLKGEKCVSCGRTLSMKSRFTKIWATAFALAAALILAYLFVPWPGTLVVTTTPEAAEVFIGGEPSGLSPFEISLSPGAYDVVIKMEGFEDFARTVTIQKHKKSDLNVDLPRTDEMPRIAYDAIRKAYQTAAYICRDLNDMAASEANLGIAESIGDSALTTAYRNQIAELVQNIDDGFAKYVETFRELKAIRPAIRDAAYQKYVQTLQHKGGSLDNLAVVWRHFNEFAGQAVSIEAWKEAIRKFC